MQQQDKALQDESVEKDEKESSSLVKFTAELKVMEKQFISLNHSSSSVPIKPASHKECDPNLVKKLCVAGSSFRVQTKLFTRGCYDILVIHVLTTSS